VLGQHARVRAAAAEERCRVSAYFSLNGTRRILVRFVDLRDLIQPSRPTSLLAGLSTAFVEKTTSSHRTARRPTSARRAGDGSDRQAVLADSAVRLRRHDVVIRDTGGCRGRTRQPPHRDRRHIGNHKLLTQMRVESDDIFGRRIAQHVRDRVRVAAVAATLKRRPRDQSWSHPRPGRRWKQRPERLHVGPFQMSRRQVRRRR